MCKTIEAVILTKSVKNGGYCVAGINVQTNQWVRFVSNDIASHGALFDKDMQYEDESYCKILDVVRIPILNNFPSEHQPENVLIDDKVYWEKTREISVPKLLEMHPPEQHDLLLGNENFYITESEIDTVGHSLILVEVKNLVITHPREHSTKATFKYRFNKYKNMSITDPDFYDTPDQTNICKAILVMSLPDAPYIMPNLEPRYYKFIAKIFPLQWKNEFFELLF